MSSDTSWHAFSEHLLRYPELGFSLDTSRLGMPEGFAASLGARVDAALDAMAALERGAIANPDENRMVGHYWLRAPGLAPTAALREAIDRTRADIAAFAEGVHSGQIAPPEGGRFTDLLVVGIGGSALGPQFVADALGTPRDPMRVHFLDNTDPDGMDRVFDTLAERLPSTLAAVISKSGGTKETRNGMIETEARFRASGLSFPKRAIAVTGEGSELDRHAAAHGWLRRFPMWDWVGGRTSVMSAVGILPMALQGLDFTSLLRGAAMMDERTRSRDPRANAAMRLALAWHFAGNGRGDRDMVVLPYKDRLLLLSRYLQQLVMESLGKELDLRGNPVHQGLSVYGNKGSTDQHAYVQQLRDGPDNFFATFIEVRKGRDGAPIEVEPGITSADYLHGFLRGTRRALSEKGRRSLTISIPEVSAEQVGALIALHERAVGFYASLVGINAYHQPGVEAGKKAAGEVLALQRRVAAALEAAPNRPTTAPALAAALGADAEDVYHLLNHLAANHPRLRVAPGDSPDADTFVLV